MPLSGKAPSLVPAQRGSVPAAPGSVFILSAPSGTGKSTLARRLVRQVPDLIRAVSHTTRAPRFGEQEGVDYFFVDEATFERMRVKGDFVEWVETFGHSYGLSQDWLQKQLATGKDILLDVNTSGARRVAQSMPRAVKVFLLPPSAGELSRRLRGRGSESDAQVTLRLGEAKHELARFREYDYLVVNETLEQASRELEAILLARRALLENRQALAEKILAEF